MVAGDRRATRQPASPDNPTGATYVLPHMDPSGTSYTTLTNFTPKKGLPPCGPSRQRNIRPGSRRADQ